MLHTQHEYCLLAILGILIHLLTTIIYRRNKNAPFSISYLLTDSRNYLRLLLAIASTFAILLMIDDVAEVFHLKLGDGTPMKHLIAFFAGYFNHSLIKRLVGFFNNKFKN